MADPTDPAGQAISSGAQPAPGSHPAAPGKSEAAFVPDRADGAVVYRPLSLPAVAGLALAALYAAFLLLEWLVAWARGSSVLMSAYWLLWPATALVVSALAWVQVQRSEGTRAGARLAVWGMILSGLFGFGYGAYHLAIFAALQLQSEDFTNRWLGLIRDGKLDDAFLLTLPPSERPTSTGADLHRELELRFNTTKEGGPHGPLATFLESPLVRMINHGGTPEAGAETQVRATGVRRWEYKDAGYRLELGYVVTTPEREVEVMIALHGTEGKRKGGRTWAVLFGESGPQAELRKFPLADRLNLLRGSSHDFMEAWLSKLGNGRIEEAYLDTQAPAQRDALHREYQARLALAAQAAGADPFAAGPLADTELSRQLYLPGYRDFRKGSLVQAGTDVFWAEGPLQQTIPAEIRKMFEQPALLHDSVRMDKPTLNLWRREGDQVRMAHGFQMMVGDHGYVVVGDLIAATDARVLEDGGQRPVWQLVALELHRGRTMTAPPHSAVAPPPPPPPLHP
jgi:hypothetical protein